MFLLPLVLLLLVVAVEVVVVVVALVLNESANSQEQAQVTGRNKPIREIAIHFLLVLYSPSLHTLI